MSTTRLVVGYAAILGTLPYLLLKGAWLSGSTIGITDPAMAHDGSLFVLNLITAGMDLVAIVVALGLTYPWGQRVPAWLVFFPMWVGAGFLAPITLALPFIGLSTSDIKFLEPWVQPVVYSGFAWQGITLMLAFALYARVRWPGVVTVWRGVAFVSSGALFAWGCWGLVNLLGNTVLDSGGSVALEAGKVLAGLVIGYACARSAMSRLSPDALVARLP